MKNPRSEFAFVSASRFAADLLILAALLLLSQRAQAHLTYNGRDFGSYSGLTNASKTITNQAVTGNYGWADAADGILGDSHHARAFRFHLDNAALVTVAVTSNPTATTNSVGGLTPAFSVYAGLAAVAPLPASNTANPPSADHDFGEASTAWRTWWVQQNLDPLATDASATDGSWNAVGDWKIGGDGDLPGDFSQLSSFIYLGSARSTESGGTATGRFVLEAGDYTVLIGGNDISNKTAGTALGAYGITATLTVTPAPSLSIAPKVFVAWPSGTSSNWVLQSASSLHSSKWTVVTNAAVVLDGVHGVLVDSAGAQRYFRFDYLP